MFEPIPLEVFEQRTGIGRRDFIQEKWAAADSIVSLRQLVEIKSVQLMPFPYLQQLLRRVTLAGDEMILPYESCEIQLTSADSNTLLIGQTFIERPKYQAMLEEFNDVFRGFCTPRGIVNRPPMIIFGLAASGEKAIAHYLPPIIEANGVANGEWLLLDGVHRNFISQRAGVSPQSILIKGVKIPFPCTPNQWDAVIVVDEKPPKEERFFDLQEDLFRNLKHIGIDG